MRHILIAITFIVTASSVSFAQIARHILDFSVDAEPPVQMFVEDGFKFKDYKFDSSGSRHYHEIWITEKARYTKLSKSHGKLEAIRLRYDTNGILISKKKTLYRNRRLKGKTRFDDIIYYY